MGSPCTVLDTYLAFDENGHSEEESYLVFGENGHPEEEFTDKLLELFYKLVRGASKDFIDSLVQAIFLEARNTENTELIRKLCLLAFQTRSCRGGKGERNCFYALMHAMWKESPQLVFSLIHLMPQYGYWKDLLNFLEFVYFQVKKPIDMELRRECPSKNAKFSALEFTVYNVFASQLRKDKAATNDTDVSLAAKYAPTENGHHGKLMQADKKMCENLFGGRHPEHMKKYRKLLTNLREKLNVMETKMCQGNWKKIKVETIPSRAMSIYKRSMLMEGKNTKITEVEDRIQCRDNVIQHIKDGGIFRGQQVYPHELVCEVRKLQEKSEALEQIVNAQWANMMAGLKSETEGPTNSFVAMCDVSGSMEGTPMDVAIALGIVMSQLQPEEKFKDKILTFTADPEWVELNPEHTFVEKVKNLASANWGWNTDFYRALRKILEISKQCDEVPNLLVISDMQFDVAGTNEDSASWNTAMENVTREFASYGLKVPIIVFWNVRAAAVGMPSKHECDNVVYMSGFSPALLKFLLTGELESVGSDPAEPKKKITPTEMLRRVLDDPHLHAVRAVLEAMHQPTLFGTNAVEAAEKTSEA